VIAGANRLLRQAAITLEWNGTISYTNRNDWYTLALPPDNVATNGSAIWQLMNCANNTGGIELYFVNNLVAPGGGNVPVASGFNVRGWGLALGNQATGHTLAHETLHECGLDDIYNGKGGLSVSGTVSADRMSASDWGGGYYPPGLTQADFNQGRLLMYGVGDSGGATSFDLPCGSVYGVGENAFPQTGYFLGPVPVGRGGMDAGEPVH
jgi:hypothetical protein